MAGLQDIDRLNRMVTNLYTAAFERQRISTNAVIKEAVTIKEKLNLNIQEADDFPPLGIPLPAIAYSDVQQSGGTYAYSTGISSESLRVWWQLVGANVNTFIFTFNASWTTSHPGGFQNAVALFYGSGASNYAALFYDFTNTRWTLRTYNGVSTTDVHLPLSYTAAGNRTVAVYLGSSGVSLHAGSLSASGGITFNNTNGLPFYIGSFPSGGLGAQFGHIRAQVQLFAAISSPADPFSFTSASHLAGIRLREALGFEIAQASLNSVTGAQCRFLWEGGRPDTLYPGLLGMDPLTALKHQGSRADESTAA